MRMNGAHGIVKSLIEHGVDIIFGYPGGAIMPTYDALYDYRKSLKHVLVRHEQGAIHAAEGYARATGKVGVCIATSGPGATNLITGIADAMLDSVPVVCITGQVAKEFLGTDAFQEADIIGMTVPITKWNHQIVHADEIPEVMAKAIDIATSGRPGPVLVDITKCAQIESFDYAPYKVKKAAQPHTYIDHDSVRQAAELINQAERPYMFIGQGVLLSKAEEEVLALAQKADIPVASTLLGLSAFPSKHRLYKGMLGMHGNYATNLLVNQADVIIAVGMRFDDRVTGNLKNYLKNAKIIHIEIDQAEMHKNVTIHVPLLGDAKVLLQALIPKIHKNEHPKWQLEFQNYYALETQKVISKEISPSQGKIKMAEVIHQISEKTGGDAVIVSDVGQHQMITARYYKFNQTNSHISSGGLGTMGFALPAAIGAKLGAPHRDVIAISGDGGVQMNIQELAVVTQENIPLKIIILNNGYLGMVRQWQELYFDKRYSFTELTSPDFVTIAKAYNIKGQRVSNRNQLDNAIDKMLHSDESYLLEIIVEKQDNVFPMMGPGASVDETLLE